MDWIAGTDRNDCGQLCVKAQELDGSWALKGLESVRPDLPVPGTVRRKVRVPLHDLWPGATRQYLDDLGLGALDASGQPVYEVQTDAGRLVIPAQLLVLAVLGANIQFRKVLLRPWGPRFLMSAFAAPGSGPLSIVPTPNRMLQLQFQYLTLVSRLEWVLSYPSATAAWGSVYRHALDGRFDLSMPRAFATVSLLARPVQGRLLVTQLQLEALTPAEEPHPFAAAGAKREFLFDKRAHQRTTHGSAAAPRSDESLASCAGTVEPLTDRQWGRIEPVIQGSLRPSGAELAGAPRAHSLRALVDVILLKLGNSVPWAKVHADERLAQGARVLLAKLKRRGDWDGVVTALRT
jgi:hypothetical protein